MIAVCREVDRDSGRIEISPLDVDVTNDLLLKLSIRARMNPELRCFLIPRIKWESEYLQPELKKFLKRKTVDSESLELMGIVEL